MKTKLTLTLILIFHSYFLISQSLIQSFSFTDSLDNWTPSPTGAVSWQWENDGMADNGTYWNSRDAINKGTTGGAAVFDADEYSSSGVIEPMVPYTLTSPIIAVGGLPNVYLEFSQYFRNFNSTAIVEILMPGMNPVTIYDNNNVNNNVETSSSDKVVIDISTYAAMSGEIQIRFSFTGTYYYWIVDEVALYNEDPSPEVFPKKYQDSLEVWGYPYEVDTSNWAYVPNELVVQFSLDATPAERQAVRDSVGAFLKDSCVCSRLELWGLGEPGGTDLSPNGNSIDINEGVKNTSAKSKIDGVDLNRYNFGELKDSLIIPNLPIDSLPSNIPVTPSDATKIAILDTGIDLNHDYLKKYIHWNSSEEFDGSDNDENCLVDDPLGWNFVDDNNNPHDDHSHGTHVAGIIKRNLENYGGPNCEYRIISYKTHDYHGTSNLFDVTCGTYQAMVDSVDVINDSWGFYGDPSEILNNAIDTVADKDILIVTASGNDTIDLADHPQYPACYFSPNVITVGSYDSIINYSGMTLDHSDFSNFCPSCVDIAAPGRDVLSSYPNNMMGLKTGTSMAAPAVAAAAAIVYCTDPPNYLHVKSNVLNCSWKFSNELGNEVMSGNVLNLNFDCLVPIDEIEINKNLDFQIFPNPVVDQLNIVSKEQHEKVKINIFSLTGKLIYQKDFNVLEKGDSQEIDLNKFSSGIYFLKIQEGDYIWSYKIVKI